MVIEQIHVPLVGVVEMAELTQNVANLPRGVAQWQSIMLVCGQMR